MISRILLAVIFFAGCVSASPTAIDVAPRVDLGAPLADIINLILANFTAPIPLLEKLDFPNLAQSVGDLINATSPVRGSLYLRNVVMTGLDQSEVIRSSLNFTTILNPLSLDFGLDGPEFALEGDYTADMVLLALVPVKGNGRFKCAIQGLTAGYTGSLRLVLPFSVKNSNYTFTLDAINVRFEGLLGNADLADTINRLASDILTNVVLKAVLQLEAAVHTELVDILAAVINEILSNFTIAQLLEFLNNLLKPPAY